MTAMLQAQMEILFAPEVYTSGPQPALTEAELRAEGFMADLPPVPTVLTSVLGGYTSGLQPALTETELHAGGFSTAQHEAQMGSTCVGVVGDVADRSRVKQASESLLRSRQVLVKTDRGGVHRKTHIAHSRIQIRDEIDVAWPAILGDRLTQQIIDDPLCLSTTIERVTIFVAPNSFQKCCETRIGANSVRIFFTFIKKWFSAPTPIVRHPVL